MGVPFSRGVFTVLCKQAKIILASEFFLLFFSLLPLLLPSQIFLTQGLD